MTDNNSNQDRDLYLESTKTLLFLARLSEEAYQRELQREAKGLAPIQHAKSEYVDWSNKCKPQVGYNDHNPCR